MPDDAKIESFVVRNADYYRKKWQMFHDRPGSVVSFNLAACLGQVVWLAYRRLYGLLFWVAVVTVADVSLVLYLEESQLVPAEWMAAWNWFFAFAYLAVFGFFGNYWYWRKFRTIERQAASGQRDRDAQLQVLRSRGGTSSFAAWLIVMLLLAPVAWALYQLYRADYSGLVLDATGPLTLAEVQANFLDRMDGPLTAEQKECIYREVAERARAAGDPETLDPATLELLPAEEWDRLDAFGKRLILTQVITTKSLFVCD